MTTRRRTQKKAAGPEGNGRYFDPRRTPTELEVALKASQVDDGGGVYSVECVHRLGFAGPLEAQRAGMLYYAEYLKALNEPKVDPLEAGQRAAMKLWRSAEVRVFGYGPDWDDRILSEKEKEAFLAIPGNAAHGVMVGNVASERFGGQAKALPFKRSGTSSE